MAEKKAKAAAKPRIRAPKAASQAALAPVPRLPRSERGGGGAAPSEAGVS